MVFNLKKVLRALLFSSSRPLSSKDIQSALTRFHEQSALPAEDVVEEKAPHSPSRPGSLPPPVEQAGAGTGEPPATESIPPVAGENSESLPTNGLADSIPSASAAVATPSSENYLPGISLPELPPEEAELYSHVPSLITAAQIREAMDLIAEELRQLDLGLILLESADGYRLVTHPRYARWVRILRDEPPPVRLSQSVLETLAVIAYRQPVTRTEIEHIRGVSAEASLAKLLEREFIYIMGRADLPGRPLQYGTTDAFLEFIGVRSLDELPASDVLSHRQIDEWLQNTTSAKPPTDADMGLPLELGEGDSPNFEPVTVNHDGGSATGSMPPPAPIPAVPLAADPIADAEPKEPPAPPEAAPSPGQSSD